MSNNQSISFLELVGGVVIFIVFLMILCIPGCSMSEHRKKEYRQEVINELCNKNKGKYDFCKLDKITYKYKEKINNESK